MSVKAVSSKGNNIFSVRHEMLQINIYYIKVLVLEGFFLIKHQKRKGTYCFSPLGPWGDTGLYILLTGPQEITIMKKL